MEGVYDLLRKDGYRVAIVQNPTMSLEGDVAATNMVIDALSEPVILVGHSYGGAVITEAGTNPKGCGARQAAARYPLFRSVDPIELARDDVAPSALVDAALDALVGRGREG